MVGFRGRFSLSRKSKQSNKTPATQQLSRLRKNKALRTLSSKKIRARLEGVSRQIDEQEKEINAVKLLINEKSGELASQEKLSAECYEKGLSFREEIVRISNGDRENWRRSRGILRLVTKYTPSKEALSKLANLNLQYSEVSQRGSAVGNIRRQLEKSLDELRRRLDLLKFDHPILIRIRENLETYLRRAEMKESQEQAKQQAAKDAVSAKLSYQKDRHRIERDKLAARVSAADKKSRRRAKAIKARLEMHEECPYCGKKLDGNIVADHIIPISLGGLSAIENMVNICSPCNALKGAATLREFIVANKLDRENIEVRLMKLGKRF